MFSLLPFHLPFSVCSCSSIATAAFWLSLKFSKSIRDWLDPSHPLPYILILTISAFSLVPVEVDLERKVHF